MNIFKQPILLVEDNDDDVFFMKRALKEAGLENPVHRVGDGQEGVDYLAGKGPFSDRSRYPAPALVLLDLQMPKKTGLEVLEWIKTRPELATLIVVVLTTSEHPKDITQAYKLGARSYLVKPPTTHQLKELVEALKVCWVGYNEGESEMRSSQPEA